MKIRWPFSFRNIIDAPVTCDVHGDVGQQCSGELGLQCALCVKFLRLYVPNKPLAVTRRTLHAMLNPETSACSACGDVTATFNKGSESAMYVLLDPARGMVHDNIAVVHWRCFVVLGPNRVNTRDESVKILEFMAAAAMLGGCASRILGQGSALQQKSYSDPLVPQPILAGPTKLAPIPVLGIHLKSMQTRHNRRWGATADFDLTADKLVHIFNACDECCAICHQKIDLDTRDARVRLSWDRHDNSQGYTASNTRPSHWACNSLKSSFSTEECIALVRKYLSKLGSIMVVLPVTNQPSGGDRGAMADPSGGDRGAMATPAEIERELAFITQTLGVSVYIISKRVVERQNMRREDRLSKQLRAGVIQTRLGKKRQQPQTYHV